MWGTKVKSKLRWVTDSKSAITRVKEITDVGHWPTKQPNNVDLLEQIKVLYSSTIRQKISPTWVKGHQTASQNLTSQTDFDIIRNNHVDELATWYRNQRPQPQLKESTDHISETKISVLLNGVRLTGNIDTCIQYHINGYHLRDYLQSRKGWSNDRWDLIEMETFRVVYKTLPFTQQVFQTKSIFDQWPVGTN